ncbi:MAG: hypothetical protein ACYDHH_23075 [Solirubrobacteraceae bacterium]
MAALLATLVGALGTAGVWSAAAQTVHGPRLGRTIEVAPVSGHVFVRLPRSSHYIALLHPTVVPVGSGLDTTHGAVDLTSAGGPGIGLQKGVFNGGAFIVQQPRSGETNLILTGGTRPTVCLHARGAAASGANPPPRVLRTLHAHAHGRFTTRGRYAAATVRGTIWTTADTCAGTTISAQKDMVDTTANTFPESVHVPLSPGQSVTYRCARHARPPVTKLYCVVILASNAPLRGQTAFSTFLATTNSARSAQLCIQPPRAAGPSCTRYPLSPPTDLGLRDLNVACPASQGPGLYRIGFRLDGVALGPPFDYRAPHIPLGHGPCHSLLGQLKQGTSAAVLGANLKLVNQYSLFSPAIAPYMGLALKPTGAPGAEQVQGIVYADSNGVPGALVAGTRPVTIGPTSPASVYQLFFSKALHLNPGKYWLGLLTGGDSSVAGILVFPVPHSAPLNANNFAAGPSNPFGPIKEVAGAQMTLFLEYAVEP